MDCLGFWKLRFHYNGNSSSSVQEDDGVTVLGPLILGQGIYKKGSWMKLVIDAF